MARGRARHLRRRRGPLLAVVLIVALLGLASTVVATNIVPLRHRKISVTIEMAGAPHLVAVAKPATIASALQAGHLAPKPGRLLSLVTKTVLNPALTPPRLAIDGVAATLESPLRAGANVAVVEPPDVTEDVVDGVDVIAAPPEPEVIHAMWHPGQPGKSASRKGSVSGEVVAHKDVQAPVPPAPVTEKLVALTFDDGPWPTTPDVLRVLREKNVKATFCVVTRQLRGQALAYTQGALAEGHKVCNHTVDHDQQLPSKPQKVVDDEIRGGNRQLQERLGFRPFYYRAPGGAMGPSIEATAKDEGQQVLLWTIDTKDYTKPPPAAIVGSVIGNLKPGAVILMHDGGGDRNNTVAALPTMIDQIRAAGYDFALPELIPPVPPGPISPAGLPS